MKLIIKFIFWFQSTKYNINNNYQIQKFIMKYQKNTKQRINIKEIINLIQVN